MQPLTRRVSYMKMRRINELICVLLLTFMLFYVNSRWFSHTNDDNSYENIFLPTEIKNNNNLNDQTDGRPDLPKYIHLDLKGAPPKSHKFYESFFNFLEKIQMGVKGIVMEYEDMLPLENKLQDVTHQNGYTKADIQLIIDSANKYQLKIIPLIQTFGHLEWILKLKRFESYRDDPNSPMVISPCHNDTYNLLEDLLQQTLDLHPHSDIIHIGCDEVHLEDVRYQCENMKMSSSERYITHLRRVVDIVHKIRPGIRILIWDDILRGEEFLTNAHLLNQLKDLVEPVSWRYFPVFDENYKSSAAWNIYPEYFQHTWAASAFKGGIHRFSMITNTTHHVLNNRQWLHFIESSQFKKDSFTGIILTGWSRFDHFMPLCDLLPTAYSALLYSLHVINTNKMLHDHSIFNCDELLTSINKNPELCQSLPGVSIQSTVILLSRHLSKIEHHLRILDTISPAYNRKHSFVRRHDLDGYVYEVEKSQRNLLSIEVQLKKEMAELYSDDIIYEWLDLYLVPTMKRINSTITELSLARKKTSWERRPIAA